MIPAPTCCGSTGVGEPRFEHSFDKVGEREGVREWCSELTEDPRDKMELWERSGRDTATDDVVGDVVDADVQLVPVAATATEGLPVGAPAGCIPFQI